MKRNLADSSTRSAAGCFPVPLFNQRKRNRQPLTSNPLKNEPSTSSTTHSYDFSPTTMQSGWKVAKPEVAQLQKTVHSGAEEKNINTRVWNRNKYMPLNSTSDLISDSEIIQKFDKMSNTLRTVQQHKPDHKASQHTDITETGQMDSATAQRSVKPSTTSRSLQDHSLAYKFKHNFPQSKVNDKQFDHVPEDNTIQKLPANHLKLKEKDNSLKIISVVIESMKHWSQYTYKTPLLFEVLGTLDSAVTPGAFEAKNFLLRDKKESLTCVFYEIDRELPRLIRGRVHRCMGNYDTKKNIFKCVSVRPATLAEQQTFHEFVRIADIEMGEYVKTMNEV
ncbi:PREDICTED: spermatogenesis-associated protein 22 [Crocodylus porosus]|uniref:spermatogenesis-associated protein 22 n=1 Tax=Crocodylus porosus TaxID=8502 RepID=UPI00093E21F5|nr:PREDICTED: spermatogenesis-associated protein 22 [Crocodylus porosus]